MRGRGTLGTGDTAPCPGPLIGVTLSLVTLSHVTLCHTCPAPADAITRSGFGFLNSKVSPVSVPDNFLTTSSFLNIAPAAGQCSISEIIGETHPRSVQCSGIRNRARSGALLHSRICISFACCLCGARPSPAQPRGT